jgi:hypothetical protein
MLNLKLRDEFLGSHMPGTAISLRKSDHTGAAQQDPDKILSITYPTADVQGALRAIGSKRPGRPIVLMGDRGRGKSHIMAVMHHAVQTPDHVEAWAKDWGQKLNEDALKTTDLQKGFFAISEPVHNQEYPLLWNLLFDRHPKGDFFRGKFQQMDQPYPPRSLLEEMLEQHPIAFILDEFQRWFDGLYDEAGSTGRKWRENASNFIQNLSEISKDRPEILILVVSVLNSDTEAFRQIHRDGPIVVDFRGPTAKRDRQNLVLYRLFRNRENIPTKDIQDLTSAYGQERFRLRFSHLSEAEKPRLVNEVADCWPFSPELLDLLEDHILMATAAQETRDLIRILAQVYKARGEETPVISPADFFVDDDACGVQSLLDSIATTGHQDKLREVARKNLETIRTLGISIPHARELVSALWMRSMSPYKNPGGTRQELHLDITRDTVIDDNSFQGEIVLLIENSDNIHGEEKTDGRLYFGTEVNPRSKVRSTAKNHKLWKPGAEGVSTGETIYPGKDIEHMRNTLKHLFVPETKQSVSRIVVLGPNWKDDPWSEVEDADKPQNWDSPLLLVIPDQIHRNGEDASAILGTWLAKHVQSRRNTVRFLLLGIGEKGIFEDDDLTYNARCSYLTSREAWGSDTTYRLLHSDFDKPLRDALKGRFNRFAILKRWDFKNPEQCAFDVEKISGQGGEIPPAVEEKLIIDFFDPTEFQDFVLDRAKDRHLVGDLLDELSEPPPPSTGDAIPFLGDTVIYEKILDIAAKGEIILNVGGNWVGRLPDHSSNDEALKYIRPRAFRSGKEMRQVLVALPGASGGTTVVGPGAEQQPTPTPDIGPITSTPEPTTIPVSPTQPGWQDDGNISPPPKVGDPVSGTVPVTKPSVVKSTDEPNTGINLSGCFERWNIPSEITLDNARIEFKDLTVQQVKQILQRIPSAFRASLEVTYSQEENDS